MVGVLKRSGVAAVMAALATIPAMAQQQPAPMFFDARRLPDMEVERRNQEVLQEQRRVAEERRLETEVTTKRRNEETRIAAQADRKAMEDAKRAQEAKVAADSQRKADDDKRLAFDAETQKKADGDRVANLAAETQRKADDEKRSAAAALAQRKADDETRALALAEAKKKADEARIAAAAETTRKAEEARIAAAAEATRKAEETRIAAAAEATRKAEEGRVAAAADARKKAAEAKLASDAARNAEEDRRLAAAAAPAQRLQTTAMLTTPPAPIPNAANPAPAGGCEAAKVTTQPLVGARMQLSIESACRKAQTVTLKYGEHTFSQKLDNSGRGSLVFDLYLGKDEPVDLSFADGKTDVARPISTDWASVQKVALIWKGPIELDLHAFENGATFGKPGHVWSGAASSPNAAIAQMAEQGRGSGFISSVGNSQSDGNKLMVYTWFHSPEQDTGAVTLALDYASRGAKPSGDMCGQGPLAEVAYDIVILDSKSQVQNESGLIPSVKCGEALTMNARYLRGIIPDLRFKR